MTSPIDKMLDAVEWERIELAPPESRESGLPVATHKGALTVGGITLKVYQLSNGQRVIDQDSLLELLELATETEVRDDASA